MSMSLPNFRTLKQGDHVSAREWNALVAFIKGMSRSSMTDGIMDSTGFHPRRKLSAAAGVDPIITLLGPNGYTQYQPDVMNKIEWLCWLTSFPGNFEVESNKINIILKKTGWYEFVHNLTFTKSGSGTLAQQFSIIEWLKNNKWYYYAEGFSSLYTDPESFAVTTRQRKGTTGLFFEKDSKIRIANWMHLSSGSGTTYTAVNPGFQMYIKYCGDIKPTSLFKYQNQVSAMEDAT